MSRKKIPHFRFYIDDFLDGTRDMSSAEVGDYVRLLCMIYDADGQLRFEPFGLRHVLGCTRAVDVVQRVMRLVDRGKLTLSSDGLLTNGRASLEIQKRQDWVSNKKKLGNLSVPAAKGAAKGAAKPQGKPQASAQKSQRNLWGSVHSRRNPVPVKENKEKERKESPTGNGIAATAEALGFEGHAPAAPSEDLTPEDIAAIKQRLTWAH